jgi:membrane complex biogenesis BtpA family protein
VSEWIRARPLVGVIGVPALPGAAAYAGASYRDLRARVLGDACAYRDAGFDAVMIQNLGDLPVAVTAGPETVAWLAALGRALRDRLELPIGVSVLKNDGCAALAVAQAIEAQFVRVKVWVGAMVGAEGIVEGAAREVLRYRSMIGAQAISIWADVHDRTGTPLASLPVDETAREAVGFGRADALVITGGSEAETLEWLERVKAAVGAVPVLAGGGVRQGNLHAVMARADGAIVATSVKVRGELHNPVDPVMAAALVAEARRVRELLGEGVR